ncbi:hypothetical protein EJV47_10075 [Hymenobacter gummosus]|uniref:VCBS repeat-containing protein n=1 Tax=Hymenobacter gummosus TaxID=1776032 RepID=A0A3S0HNF9_9BACT|nr:hypothetical protein [Hymenobacter gummosus]RTQ49981.1 hypothetical protein EJV47_10075 [Hymenobacter gummosus]
MLPRSLPCLLAAVLLGGCYFNAASRNPFAEVDWLEEHPGAGDRYVTFTPVLKADHAVVLGPAIGADYGELTFRDLNHDGMPEVIVETNTPIYEEELSVDRQVLQYRQQPGQRPAFVLIESTEH